jgi:hypothetical protein
MFIGFEKIGVDEGEQKPKNSRKEKVDLVQ